MPSIIRAYVYSKATRLPHSASYGMIVDRPSETAYYWGTRNVTQPQTMEMHGAHRLLTAIHLSECDFKIEIIAKSRHLSTRIDQAMNTKIKIEAGIKAPPIDDQELWFETAVLWISLDVGLRCPITDHEKQRLKSAKACAHSVYTPHSTSDLLDDGLPISFDNPT